MNQNMQSIDKILSELNERRKLLNAKMSELKAENEAINLELFELMGKSKPAQQAYIQSQLKKMKTEK